jgi:geranyl-CoA carboxylase alpha subunit
MTQINTLLVANRGEIALRVMRTARALGIRTVAVYSTADARAPHVQFADDSVCLGPAPVSDSYLRADAVLAAARETGADAIHPGYGFLSENASFAESVSRAGLIFVGPPPEAIEVMGDKAISKRKMLASGVPCIPGYEGDDQADATLLGAAEEIGFPLMVKAAAGGGGRGMRLVSRSDDLADALQLARSEAENAFGSGTLILEKAIVAPRHVEVQVFADTHGNVIHLGERDCSVQRRHQKVIEESPCPVMTPELRARMGEAAVEAARAVAYEGAGTVEFLLDADGNFYFLEMNTRLQVEHPVTELVTGLDLVALQLRVAQGERLGLEQSDVSLSGHAIEVRLYAEDPDQDFLPSTGPVMLWQKPVGEGIRVDDGIVSGGEVSPFYDSMVAKIIACADSREEARRRLQNGLERTALHGLKSNRDFLLDALSQSTFIEGAATTAFIAECYGDQGFSARQPGEKELAAAAVLQHALARRAALDEAVAVSAELLDWSSAADLESIFSCQQGDRVVDVSVRPVSVGEYVVHVGRGADDDGADVDVELICLEESVIELKVAGRTQRIAFSQQDATVWLSTQDRTFSVTDVSGASSAEAEAGGGGIVRAPMHGLLLELLVSKGDRVAQGDKLAVLEAMKMQHELIAEVDGEVVEVAAATGSQIAADELILEIALDTD